MHKKCCYGWHCKARCHQILKELSKSKYDNVPMRIGNSYKRIIQLFAMFDCEYSSTHKSWKNQTKFKKQWMKR